MSSPPADAPTFARELCSRHQHQRHRLMDILLAVQGRYRHIPEEVIAVLSGELGIPRVDIRAMIEFYAFFTATPTGDIVIRLCDDVVDIHQGALETAQALCDELGIDFGETTEDGRFTLEWTPCIGMSDQAPAALVEDTVVTQLTPEKARTMIRSLREHGDPHRLVRRCGDGNNAHRLIRAMVDNNIRRRGPVLLSPSEPEAGLRRAIAMSPAEVIRAVKNARLRGRGGAGFPTGLKWEFTRAAEGEHRVVICNGDEGEPGTFKDRVMLTEAPDLLFEGMAIAGYALGATEGILYLRGEYAYLRRWLEHRLEERRARGLLGEKILGKEGFDFDIRIQMGAGAYICGEETALINSCEGLPGETRNRPPFPAQHGYLGRPTAVNNVESYCCVARILDRGAAWFAQLGSEGSSGTKLVSLSGDCMAPGIYEIEYGRPLRDLLEESGGEHAAAVQVGGPSGRLVPPEEFDRELCYDDLATGGAVTVFGPERDLFDVARRFLVFFHEESCGHCTPCRVGNKLLLQGLDDLIAGKATREDLEGLEQLATHMKTASRCGLGQTSPNPLKSLLEGFRPLVESRLVESNGLRPNFDVARALQSAREIAGRDSVHYPASPVAEGVEA